MILLIAQLAGALYSELEIEACNELASSRRLVAAIKVD